MSRIFRSTTIRSALLSTVGIWFPIAAHAQDASSTPETVTVTGTRITRPGFEAPTPVTTIRRIGSLKVRHHNNRRHAQ